MERRTLLASLPTAVVVAGCTHQSGGFTDAENGSTSGDGTPEIPEPVRRLQRNAADRGLEIIDTSVRENLIVLTIQTVGNIDDDIRRMAGAYATVSVVLERDLRVHVEDRGLQQATFEINLDWAKRFANERLSDAEYLDRIRETKTER